MTHACGAELPSHCCPEDCGTVLLSDDCQHPNCVRIGGSFTSAGYLWDQRRSAFVRPWLHPDVAGAVILLQDAPAGWLVEVQSRASDGTLSQVSVCEESSLEISGTRTGRIGSEDPKLSRPPRGLDQDREADLIRSLRETLQALGPCSQRRLRHLGYSTELVKRAISAGYVVMRAHGVQTVPEYRPKRGESP